MEQNDDFWYEYDWDEPKVPDVLKKTDVSVEKGRLNRLRADDPEWVRKQKEGSAKTRTDPEWKKKMSAVAIRRLADPEWKDKHSAAIAAVTDTPEYKEACKQRAKKNEKPVVTPKGVFTSLNAAAAAYGQSYTGIQYKMRTKPTEFYYISREDFEKLTSENK